MISIKVEKAKIEQKKTPLLVIGIFEKEQDFVHLKELDSNILSAIREMVNNGEFTGTFGSSILLPTMGKGPMKKILFFGLGKKQKYNNEKARVIAGKAALKAQDLRISEFDILPFSDPDDSLVEAIAEGICLSLYSFKKYKTDPDENNLIVSQARIIVNSDPSRFQSMVDRAILISQAVYLARDLGNLPPNDCPPANLAGTAQSIASEYNMNIQVIERYEMESMGMGGIIAVGKGSDNPPKLIVIEYHGATAEQKPYLFVGKAVTFDTGGISLKPGDRMDEMKFDKCGGCTVLSIMKAVASLRLPVNVVGIVPAVENMPSSTSYRPGDIIRMYNKKTVEVLNTDAEGRMILADALSYGIEKYKPKCAIDFATLTGACIIALGANVAAMLGNNRQLIERLKLFSEITGEKIWELPLYEEFNEQIKSNVADMKNIGGRPGGAITATSFLSKFVNGTPWVHVDIAGTAWTQEGTFEKSYNPKGATGFGVRTIIKFLFEDKINTSSITNSNSRESK